MSRRKQKRKKMNQANNNMQGSQNNNTNEVNSNNNYNQNKVNVYQANEEIDSVLNEIAHGINETTEKTDNTQAPVENKIEYDKDSTTAYIYNRINNIHSIDDTSTSDNTSSFDNATTQNTFVDTYITAKENDNKNENNNDNNNNDNNDVVKNDNYNNENNKESWNDVKASDDETCISNDTLLISEKDKKVFLPYSMNEIHQYMTVFSNKYSNPREVIENEFVLPLNYFTNMSFAARFREAFALYRDREGKSTLESFIFAFKTMKVGNLQPAVIAACKNEKVFKDYLIHLRNDDLDNFNYFKIEYHVTPSVK